MNILVVDDIEIEVTKKKVKYIHLKVYPPNGNVKISAPKRASNDSIKEFALEKLTWIKKQQREVRSRKREVPLQYVTNESHYFDNKCYILNVIEGTHKSGVILKDNVIEMYVKPGSIKSKRKALIENLYRKHLIDAIPQYIRKWEPVMGVSVNYFNVKRMRTKWGTCNTVRKRIWLNLELAKMDKKLLEYVVIHEMVHLLERNHTKIFYGYMDKFLPGWKNMSEELKNGPPPG